MRIDHVFLDDGDVMNDNSLRGPQWQRLVGEFFAPRLGGSEAAWAAANRHLLDELFQRDAVRLAREGEPGWSFDQTTFEYHVDWLRSMAAVVGVAEPAADEACYALAYAATAYVVPRVRAAYPGAIEAIRALGAQRSLYTASNEQSHELRGYLTGMSVEALFSGFYGADIIGRTKRSGAIYYEAVFRHAGVDPARCLVVDDKPAFLTAARAAGARTVRVGEGASLAPDEPVVAALAELPALIDAL